MLARMLRRSSAALLLGLVAVAGACGKTGNDLSVPQLTAVVSSQQETLKPCYQAALDNKPDTTEFRIQATIHVRKDGSVGSVELERGRLPEVNGCIEQTVKGWKFPAADRDTYASLPIIFRPVIEPMQAPAKWPFQ